MRIIEHLLEKIEIPRPEKRKKLEIKSSKIEDAVLAFVGWAKDRYGWKKEVWDEAFRLGRELSAELCIPADEIPLIQKYRIGGIFGFFISGLVHDLDAEFKLALLPMSGIGYRLKAGKLEVFGDRMVYLGMKMRGGKIVLHGNAGNWVGREMEGGEIVVEGSVRNWAGYGMKGGKLVIKGNAGNVLGAKMEGGEIIVYGKAGEWLGEDAKGGRIEVKGNMFLQTYSSDSKNSNIG
jgi:formylmethanofuran dehydrogenase subunit C